MAKRKSDDYWLVRPATIRLLWIIFIAVLALTVVADVFVSHHGEFGIEDTFGFSAWYGFVSCVVLVGFAKGLGLCLKRRDDYYES
jgi:hypothetical protein